MSKFRASMNKKGVVLVITLGIILVVAALSNVILSLMTSQTRLSYLQRGRIQAYYAAQAGIHLAMENLRTGAWERSPPQQKYCINCDDPNDCKPAVPKNQGGSLRWFDDSDLPLVVCIYIDPPNTSPFPNTTPVRVTVDYSSLSL